jgi:hypothetical protein
MLARRIQQMKSFAKTLVYTLAAVAIIYMIGGIVLQLAVFSALAGHGGRSRQHPMDAARQKGWNVAAGQANWYGLEALTRPDAFLSGRHVDVRTVLGFDAIRDPAQPSPTRDQQDVHAAVRATALARAECALLESLFAAKCIVQKAEAKPQRDGAYAVTMRLLFTPKDDLGRVAVSEKLSYLELPVTLGARGRYVGPSQQTSARRAMYAEAAAACARLRADNGNCGLLAMQVQTATRPGGFEVLMSGKATLATLQQQNRD